MKDATQALSDAVADAFQLTPDDPAHARAVDRVHTLAAVYAANAKFAPTPAQIRDDLMRVADGRAPSISATRSHLADRLHRDGHATTLEDALAKVGAAIGAPDGADAVRIRRAARALSRTNLKAGRLNDWALDQLIDQLVTLYKAILGKDKLPGTSRDSYHPHAPGGPFLRLVRVLSLIHI